MSWKKPVLIFALILLLSNILLSQDHIEIKYIGPVYKPIPTLLVSEIIMDVDDVYDTNIVVSRSHYAAFKRIIIKNLPKNNKKRKNEFGCFSVLLYTKKDSAIYFLSEQTVSIKYFKSVIKDLKKNTLDGSLISNISAVLNRIDYSPNTGISKHQPN